MTVRSCVWAPTSSSPGDGRCTEAHELSAKRMILVATEELVCAALELPPKEGRRGRPWAVGNSSGDYFAVTRRCRHLFPDLAGGTIDSKGCLVCPWHGSRYEVKDGPDGARPAGRLREDPRARRGMQATNAGPPARAPRGCRAQRQDYVA